MSPPVEIIKAALRADVHTLRRWFESNSEEDANASFPYPMNWSDLDDYTISLIEEQHHGTLLHCVLVGTFGDRGDRSDAVQFLVTQGADVNLRSTQVDSEDNGATPLEWCEFPGEMSVLLDAGADVDARDMDGCPLLHNVVFYANFIALAKVLLHHGADVFATNNAGRDAEGEILWMASNTSVNHEFPYVEMVAFLREVKAAGGGRQYFRAPRVELVRLRALCARGRARPPLADSVLHRLFGVPGKSVNKSTRTARRLSRQLPNEVFWHVLAFWRTSRDDYGPVRTVHSRGS